MCYLNVFLVVLPTRHESARAQFFLKTVRLSMLLQLLAWLHVSKCRNFWNTKRRTLIDTQKESCVAFCENYFCHNLKANKIKHIKVYIFKKRISQEVLFVRFFPMRNRQKMYSFLFLEKKFKYLPMSSKYVYLYRKRKLWHFCLQKKTYSLTT